MVSNNVAARVGLNIRSLRHAQGMRLEDVAKRGGLSVAQLSRLELGLRGVSVDMLFRLADALGYPAAGLMAEEFITDTKRAVLVAELEREQINLAHMRQQSDRIVELLKHRIAALEHQIAELA